MTAGMTWLGNASQSARHWRIRCHPAAVSGPPSGAIRAPRPARDPGEIRIPIQQAGDIRAGQPDRDVFLRPHQPGDQAADLVGAAEVPSLYPDGAEQAAAQLSGDPV
jgi:hypothetical protein